MIVKMAMKINISMVLCSMILLVHLGQLSAANQNCEGGKPCNINNKLHVDMTVEGDKIDISWTFNTSMPAGAFRIIIYNSDNSVEYQSPLLHMSQRTMTINKELNSGKNKICIQVVFNDTVVMGEKCVTESVSDLKVIVGVLAGTIFLIPCLVGLTIIIYKDRKISIELKQEYESLVTKEMPGNGNQAVVQIDIVKTEMKGTSRTHDNIGYVDDKEVLNKSSAATVTNGKVEENVTAKLEKEHSPKHKPGFPTGSAVNTNRDSMNIKENDNSNVDKSKGKIFTIKL